MELVRNERVQVYKGGSAKDYNEVEGSGGNPSLGSEWKCG